MWVERFRAVVGHGQSKNQTTLPTEHSQCHKGHGQIYESSGERSGGTAGFSRLHRRRGTHSGFQKEKTRLVWPAGYFCSGCLDYISLSEHCKNGCFERKNGHGRLIHSAVWLSCCRIQLTFDSVLWVLIKNFLKQSTGTNQRWRVPKFSEVNKAEQEAQELQEALQSMQSGKAPGIDGLPEDFVANYYQWRSVVGPQSLSKGRLPLSCKRAILTLLPKKGDLEDIKSCVLALHRLQAAVQSVGNKTEESDDASYPCSSITLCTQQVNNWQYYSDSGYFGPLWLIGPWAWSDFYRSRKGFWRSSTPVLVADAKGVWVQFWSHSQDQGLVQWHWQCFKD